MYADTDGEVVFVLDFGTEDIGRERIFYIQEVINEEDETVRYDTHCVTVTVTIEQDVSGELVIKAVYEGDLTFTNIARSNEVNMPSTGGSGTLLFYAGGISMIVLALGFLLLQRRKKHEADA